MENQVAKQLVDKIFAARHAPEKVLDFVAGIGDQIDWKAIEGAMQVGALVAHKNLDAETSKELFRAAFSVWLVEKFSPEQLASSKPGRWRQVVFEVSDALGQVGVDTDEAKVGVLDTTAVVLRGDLTPVKVVGAYVVVSAGAGDMELAELLVAMCPKLGTADQTPGQLSYQEAMAAIRDAVNQTDVSLEELVELANS